MKQTPDQNFITLNEHLDSDDLRLVCRLIALLDKWDRDAKITNKYKHLIENQVTKESEPYDNGNHPTVTPLRETDSRKGRRERHYNNRPGRNHDSRSKGDSDGR